MCPRYLYAGAVVVFFSFGLVAADDDSDPVQRIEAKIRHNISKDNWNAGSRVFLNALWQDYKNAHLKGDKRRDGRYSMHGRLPVVQDYDMYVGQYLRSGRPYMEIAKTNGRYFIVVDNKKLPAVPENGGIVFTTGDVVYSELPRLARKPYATLELYRIVLIDGQYFAFGVHERPESWLKIEKSKKKP